jgi:cell division septation protein DedD
MRFEVKGGGIAAILLAMTLLSGVVFVLGLLAGYDVGRQAQIETAQLATSYPLPPPVLSPSEGAGSPLPPAGSAPNSSVAENTRSSGLAPDNSTAKQNNPASASHLGGTPLSNRLVAASTPAVVPPTAFRSPSAIDAGSSTAPGSELGDKSAQSAEETKSESERKVAAPESHRRKPYNIQIEAAMDIVGADQMMERLQKLGYNSHLVPTEIDGQRWYKVEVGPYATAEEASAAEAELRQRYDATYGGVGRRSSTSQTNPSEDSEE